MLSKEAINIYVSEWMVSMTNEVTLVLHGSVGMNVLPLAASLAGNAVSFMMQ